jgi:hypothetical protein
MANKNVMNIFVAIKTLSNLFPSAAHQADRALPYVTVEDFEPFGIGTRQVSKASIIAYSPVLRTEQELHAWSTYSSNHTFWIAEGREAAESATMAAPGHEAAIKSTVPGEPDEHDDHAHRAMESEHEMHPSHPDLFGRVYKVDQTGSAVFESGNGTEIAPLWQASPVPSDTKIVNFNLASNPIFAEVLKNVIDTKREVLSKLVQAEALFGEAAAANADVSPSSLLMQPIVDLEAPGDDHPVLGVVSALIPWKALFDNVSRPMS